MAIEGIKRGGKALEGPFFTVDKGDGTYFGLSLALMTPLAFPSSANGHLLPLQLPRCASGRSSRLSWSLLRSSRLWDACSFTKLAWYLSS